MSAPPGTPPEALALALWEQRCPGVEPRFGRQAAAQLRRSAQQLDRLRGAGAAVELIGLCFDDVRQGVDRETGEVLTSVGWVVRIVKVQARDARRGDRLRRGIRADGRGQAGPQLGTWKSRGPA